MRRICHDPGVTDAHEGTLGPLVDTTVRVATWNLWWRFGPWEQRAEPILATLRAVDADVIALQEVWAEGDRNQAADLAEALGGYHHTYAAKYEFEGVWFGNAVLSRWPIADEGRQDLPTPPDEDEGRLVVRADIDGPRGRFSVYATHLHYRLHHGPIRQDQVKAVCAYIRDTAVAGYPAVLCGDFNAAPDSDEIRMLTGKAAVPRRPWSSGTSGSWSPVRVPVSRGPTTTPTPPSRPRPRPASTTCSWPGPRPAAGATPPRSGCSATNRSTGSGPRTISGS